METHHLATQGSSNVTTTNSYMHTVCTHEPTVRDCKVYSVHTRETTPIGAHSCVHTPHHPTSTYLRMYGFDCTCNRPDVQETTTTGRPYPCTSVHQFHWQCLRTYVRMSIGACTNATPCMFYTGVVNSVWVTEVKGDESLLRRAVSHTHTYELSVLTNCDWCVHQLFKATRPCTYPWRLSTYVRSNLRITSMQAPRDKALTPSP